MVGDRRRLIRPRFQNKPDLRPIDDAPVQAAVTELLRARRRKKGTAQAETQLIRQCELVQQHRDRRVRQEALWQLARHLPAGGEQVSFNAIQDDVHESCVFAGLDGAFRYARKNGVRLDRATLQAVRDLALDDRSSEMIRQFAVLLLGRASGRGVKAALIDAARRAPSEVTRAEAYQALLRYGYPPAKRQVLRDIHLRADGPAGVHDLWSNRKLFRWRADEERELRGAMERHREMFRRRLYDEGQKLGYRLGAARWLTWLAADGFELSAKDMKQARRIALLFEPDERKDLLARLWELDKTRATTRNR